VDRLDYTKGIERAAARGRALAGDAAGVGRQITFIQIAAPTRSRIEQYQE